MRMSKKIQTGGVRTPSVAKNFGKSPANACGTCASRLAMRCREVRGAIWSGHHPKNVHPSSWLRRARPRCTARGTGQAMLDERGDAWGQRSSRYKTMELCNVRPGPSSGGAELRQENAFTQRAVSMASLDDCRECRLREQCLGRGARGNRARRVSAVRRLLPAPASVEPQTGVLQATRLSWMWRVGLFAAPGLPDFGRQHVEVIALAQTPKSLSPPPRPPRAIRSHRSFRWHDRLARNAWWGPPQLRVTVAGVPAFLARSERGEAAANKEVFR